MSNQGKQVKVTTKSILKSHYFTKGYKDKLQEFGFHKDYDKWPAHFQVPYERGRMYAAATGGLIPPKIGDANKKVSRRAQNAFRELYEEGYII
jgi:hypothetical protein